jgi:hypothetical protein
MARRATRSITAQPTEGTARASDIKRLGWRGALERARQNKGQLTVTNHARAEGVILTHEAYTDLLRKAAEQDSAVERALLDLRGRFDERLKDLQGKGAANKLRAAIRSPAKLRGKVKAGQSH